MRRRCLDFEMAGARRKNLEDGSTSSSVLSQPDEKITNNENQSSLIRPCGESSSRRILSGIGLHLNALATTSKDRKITQNDNLSSGIQIRLPSSTVSIHSPTTGQEGLDKSLVSASSEIDPSATENGVLLLQDSSQAPGSLANEEFNQNSPKKKR